VASHEATAVESLLERARELLSEEGALASANALVNQALALRPDSVTAWVVKCQISSAQGDDFSALAAIEMAVRRAPQRAEALYWRGAVLGDLGRNREALRALDRAFSAVTADDAWLLEDLFYEKACVLDAMELRTEARRTLEEGLGRCPSSSLLKLALGGGRTPRSRSLLDGEPSGEPTRSEGRGDGRGEARPIEEAAQQQKRRPALTLLRGGMP
jgi:tetratricopeptide (TPR) repeat protein